MTCSRTKTTAVICSAIGLTEKEKVIELMKTCKFSIIVDETTDISAVKLLAIVVRIFCNSAVHDLFYELIEVEKADAIFLYNAIKNSFEENNINYKNNMIGFASDGANVMAGERLSVAALFKQDIPHLFVLKCVCHSFHLCCSYATQKIPEYVEQFVNDVHNYFNKSSKRIAEYSKFQEFLNLKPHKLLYASQTRWLSLQQVVDRVLEQYDALKLFFTDQSFNNENDLKQKCHDILGNLNNPLTKLYLQFLKFVLPYFTNLNTMMQSREPQIHRLKSEIRKIILTIMDFYLNLKSKENFTNIDYKNPRNFKSYNHMYFGAFVTASLIRSNSTETAITKFKSDCVNFYIESLNQLFKRFDFNDKTFDVLELLDQNKIINTQTVMPLCVAFPNIIDEQNFQTIDNEFRTFRNEEDLNFDQNPESFWISLKKIIKGDGTPAYPNLIKLMVTLCSLPHSSATCERIFSQVNLNKTKVRNKLNFATLSGLLRTKQYIAPKECFDFPIEKSVLDKMNKSMYKTKG